MHTFISAILMVIGAVFMFLAAVGVVRQPDLFLRMSSATKAATLGVGCMLLAVAVYFHELGVAVRALAGIVFVLLSAPVAAHMIGRAAYFTGVPLWEGTVVDELRGRYDMRTHELESVTFPDLEQHLPDMQIYKLRIPEDSPVTGKTLLQLDLRRRYDVTLLAIRRGALVLSNPGGEVQLFAGDEVILIGSPEKQGEIAEIFRGA